MNSCMVRYQGQDELDNARAEWFALAGERRRAKKELQDKIEEGRRKHKEWWNLDEEGKLQGKKVEVVEEEVKR
jgi:COX assembly protein 1